MLIALEDELRTEHDIENLQGIGEGAFSTVYRATVHGVACAVKISHRPVRGRGADTSREESSLELAKALNGHARVLTLFDIWYVQGYLVTRWELGQMSLSQRLQECKDQGLSGIPRDELQNYIEQAAEGIDFINTKGIRHCDIKPPNLLLVHGMVKIADLGLATFVGASTGSMSSAGTIGYMPPEAQKGLLTPTTDLYGLAASYVSLRTGNEPFGADIPTIAENQKEGRPNLAGLGPEEAAFVRAALKSDPNARPKDGALAWARGLAKADRQKPVAETSRYTTTEHIDRRETREICSSREDDIEGVIAELLCDEDPPGWTASVRQPPNPVPLLRLHVSPVIEPREHRSGCALIALGLICLILGVCWIITACYPPVANPELGVQVTCGILGTLSFFTGMWFVYRAVQMNK